MTDKEIELARQLFPGKRPRGRHYLKFYSDTQINWLREKYPDNPASLIADIMREKPVDILSLGHRLRLRHTLTYKRTKLAEALARYERRELLRLRYELPRLGKKPVTGKPYNDAQINARKRAKRKGYITGNHLSETERWFIFHDEKTRRSPVFERNLAKYRLWLLPLQNH